MENKTAFFFEKLNCINVLSCQIFFAIRQTEMQDMKTGARVTSRIILEVKIIIQLQEYSIC